MVCVLRLVVAVAVVRLASCSADDCGCITLPKVYGGQFVLKTKVSNLKSPGTVSIDNEKESYDWDWFELVGTSFGTQSKAEVTLHVNDSLPGASDRYDKSTSSGGTFTYSWQWVSKSGEVAPGGKLVGTIGGVATLTGGGRATNAASSATSTGTVSSASSIVACAPRKAEGASLTATGEAKGGEKGTVTVDVGGKIDIGASTREPGLLPNLAEGSSVTNVLKLVDGEVKGSANYDVKTVKSIQPDGGYAFGYSWTQSEPVLEVFEASNVQVIVSTAATAVATVKANGLLPLIGSAQASAHAKAFVSCSFNGDVVLCIGRPKASNTVSTDEVPSSEVPSSEVPSSDVPGL